MEVYVITKHRYTDGEGTAVYLLGVVTEENLAETMKEAKKNILNDFGEIYDEEELQDLSIEESETSVKAYFNDSFDEIWIDADKVEVDAISKKEILL